MAEGDDKDAWMRRVLGARLAPPAPPKPPRKVAFAPVPPSVQKPDGKTFRLGLGRKPSGKRIAPLEPPVQTQKFVTPEGKPLSVAKTASGRTIFTCVPPPVTEVTFSGGGGKGAALPGAIRALEDSGVLKTLKKVAGASVGSMTAAVVAAGITADEFQAMADDDATTDAITEGTGGKPLKMAWAALKNKLSTGQGSPFTGQGLENLVRDVLDATLRKRIHEHMMASEAAGQAPHPEVVAVAEAMAQRGGGPTFGDLRRLSQVLPQVKEAVMTGTYTREFITSDEGELLPLDGDGRGQLYVFDADSEPDLEVAVAVHASASFPGVFKPVDIQLANGLTVRFIDGGVMNNTPTSSSLGAGRDMLDPVPEGRNMSFVFESEDTAELLEGKAKPAQGLGARIKDLITGANNAASDYALARDLAERPEEIVVVPLRLTMPPDKKGKTRVVDMTGTLGGTLNFKPEPEVRIALQQATEQATQAHIAREQLPKPIEFDSDAQMFMCIPRSDLQALKDQQCPGADQAWQFREDVAALLQQLRGRVKAAQSADQSMTQLLNGPDVAPLLDQLDGLCQGDPDYRGHVAREMNRGGLDTLLDAARQQGQGSDKAGVLVAAQAVNEALRVHAHADHVLKQVVYPKMKHEKRGGTAIEVLLRVEDLLRAATAVTQVNAALDIAIQHFLHKSDHRIPKRGHHAFAVRLRGLRMRP